MMTASGAISLCTKKVPHSMWLSNIIICEVTQCLFDKMLSITRTAGYEDDGWTLITKTPTFFCCGDSWCIPMIKGRYMKLVSLCNITDLETNIALLPRDIKAKFAILRIELDKM